MVMHEIACAEKILKRALKRAACTEGKAQSLTEPLALKAKLKPCWVPSPTQMHVNASQQKPAVKSCNQFCTAADRCKHCV